jgi:hypothetical protein
MPIERARKGPRTSHNRHNEAKVRRIARAMPAMRKL